MNARLVLPRPSRFWSAALLCALILSVGSAAAGKLSDRIVRVTDPRAPRNLPEEGPVSVRWNDPAKFSEVRGSHNRNEAERGDWVMDIARYLRDRAERKLPADERLDITITDIRRAGNYEPWRGIEFRDIRVMRELYWPRIAIEIKHTRADGTIIAEGAQVLSDPAYLSSASTFGEGDPLRYEKNMIDRWVRRELVRTDVSAAPKP